SSGFVRAICLFFGAWGRTIRVTGTSRDSNVTETGDRQCAVIPGDERTSINRLSKKPISHESPNRGCENPLCLHVLPKLAMRSGRRATRRPKAAMAVLQVMCVMEADNPISAMKYILVAWPTRRRHE